MSRKRAAPGPYSYDDDEDYVPTTGIKYSEREDVLPLKVKKHTLDSDEEEEENDDEGGKGGGGGGEKNYDVLRDEDIDGQEEGTVAFEGDTQITPFNMKEEMEDGHFDGDGFYHFKKDADQIKDAWLDDIDWVKVKHREGDEKKYGSDIESDAGSDEEAWDIGGGGDGGGTIKVYKEIHGFLKQGETVARALKRMGGNKKISSAEKWKLKKLGSTGAAAGDGNMGDFLKLTELANKIIATGNMDVYQETYEMINLKIERSKAPPASTSPSMDMFADEQENKDKDTTTSDQKTKGESQGLDSVAQIKWELRWEDKEDAEIHGPFTNDKMLQWQESGYFNKGAYVRKTTESGQSWYSTRRIDFDLYT